MSSDKDSRVAARHVFGFLATAVAFFFISVGLFIGISVGSGLIMVAVERLSGWKFWTPGTRFTPIPNRAVLSLCIGLAIFLGARWVSSRRWSRAGRWACALVYSVCALDPGFTLSGIGGHLTFENAFPVLLMLPLVAFYGGDLGDRKREQQAKERLQAEAETDDAPLPKPPQEPAP